MRHRGLIPTVSILALLFMFAGSCDVPSGPGPGGGNINSNYNTNANTNNNGNANNNTNANDNGSSACMTDADCDDGQFCTGVESCVNGSCQDGDSPCTAMQSCVEATQVCVSDTCMTDDDCPAGQVCDEITGDCLDISASMCGPGAGLCAIENPTPGCESPECCELVCSFEPSCCISPWDSGCANMALQFCGDALNP